MPVIQDAMPSILDAGYSAVVEQEVFTFACRDPQELRWRCSRSLVSWRRTGVERKLGRDHVLRVRNCCGHYQTTRGMR